MKIVLLIVAVSIFLSISPTTANAASPREVQQFLLALHGEPCMLLEYEEYISRYKGLRRGFRAKYSINGKMYVAEYSRYSAGKLVFYIDGTAIGGKNGKVDFGFMTNFNRFIYSKSISGSKRYQKYWQSVYNSAIADSTAYFKHK